MDCCCQRELIVCKTHTWLNHWTATLWTRCHRNKSCTLVKYSFTANRFCESLQIRYAAVRSLPTVQTHNLKKTSGHFQHEPGLYCTCAKANALAAWGVAMIHRCQEAVIRCAVSGWWRVARSCSMDRWKLPNLCVQELLDRMFNIPFHRSTNWLVKSLFHSFRCFTLCGCAGCVEMISIGLDSHFTQAV